MVGDPHWRLYLGYRTATAVASKWGRIRRFGVSFLFSNAAFAARSDSIVGWKLVYPRARDRPASVGPAKLLRRLVGSSKVQ